MSARKSDALAGSKRLVVKIGSALLVNPGDGLIHRKWLASLADDVAACRARGQEVLIVSSGSIAVGLRHLGVAPDRSLRLEDKQAAAATGQIRLAHAYQDALARHDLTVAQILLTLHDTETRRQHINARNTIEALLRHGAVPVINENDTVATDQIRVGDNDRLAARVAAMVSADTLVLLSDIDGLHTEDPRRDSAATLIPEVREITPEIEAMAGAPTDRYSRGGMVTKIAAAKIAMGAGCRMAICNGGDEHPLAALAAGAPCTWFVPATTPLTARKRWIAGSLKPTGAVVVDDGAKRALHANKSLLPAGVVAVEGKFDRGDLVVVRDGAGREVGRGLMAYSASEAGKIIGHKSDEIERLLGYRLREELIHRDDLVLTT